VERVGDGEVGTRVLAAGAHACSDAELLGIVLDGGRGSLVGLAHAARVLSVAGGIGQLGRLDRRTWSSLGRLWPRRAAVVRAAVELGRRALATPLVAGALVRDAASVHAHFAGRLPQLEREVFYVLLLDGRPTCSSPRARSPRH
jgi:DNA repair protein RadC